MPVRVEMLPIAQPDDGRGRPRHRARLPIDNVPGGGTAMLHDISQTGLLLQTEAAPIAVGDIFQIDLPEAGGQAAEVIWCSGDLAGCQFRTPISNAIVSAVRLRSEPLANGLSSFPPVPSRRARPRNRVLIVTSIAVAAWVGFAFSLGVI